MAIRALDGIAPKHRLAANTRRRHTRGEMKTQSGNEHTERLADRSFADATFIEHVRTTGVIVAVAAWLLLRRIGKTLRTDPFANAVFDSSNSGCVLLGAIDRWDCSCHLGRIKCSDHAILANESRITRHPELVARLSGRQPRSRPSRSRASQSCDFHARSPTRYRRVLYA